MSLTRYVLLPLLILLLTGALVAVANQPSQPEPSGTNGTAADKQSPNAATEGGLGKKTPSETVNATKGTLKNPFTDQPDRVEEGKKLFLSYGCNGCHGGGGGGGMCPPLTNETWIYGSDDDTLFRLITLGSRDLMAKQGYARKRQEAVKGPMPPYIEIIDDSDKLWKIIAFIRSVYKGRAEKRDW